MQKGNKQRTASLEKLCELLNDDPEVKAACQNIPLKCATVRDWIQTKAPAIAEEGIKIKEKAASQGGEKVLET